MNILIFLLIGLVAGWLAGVRTEGRGFGLVGDLVVGVVGALLGGFVFGLFRIAAWGLLGQIVMAAAGAVLLLFVIRLVKRTGPALR